MDKGACRTPTSLVMKLCVYVICKYIENYISLKIEENLSKQIWLGDLQMTTFYSDMTKTKLNLYMYLNGRVG